MRSLTFSLGTMILLLATDCAAAQEPVLRVEPEGPTAFVTALAFSPDGKQLYAAGLDKVVHVWRLNAKGDAFEPSEVAFRVPMGPGHEGALNAMVLSPDGKLLAVGGRGLTRDSATFRQPGLVLPRAGGRSADALLDEGTIYVFDTITGKPRALRGHLGPVLALGFAPARKDKHAVLASLAQEDQDGKHGVLRLWDADTGAELANLKNLPSLVPENGSDVLRPGLAVWRTGNGPNDVRVALALGQFELRDKKRVWEGKLRIWEPDQPVVEIDERHDLPADNIAFDHTAIYLEGQDRLITGSYDDKARQGRLQAWGGLDKALPVADQTRRVLFPSGSGIKTVQTPRAITSFASKPGAPADQLATAILFTDQPNKWKFELRIVQMEGDTWSDKSAVKLWDMQGQDSPVLAAAGGFLAAAGNTANEIWIFPIDTLQKGKDPKPAQRLQSAGLAFSKATFVKKDGTLGLALTDAAAGTERIFDPVKGRLADATGWKLDRPDLGGWSAKFNANGQFPRIAEIRQAGKLIGTVTLDKSQVETDLALLPPGDLINVPILAVAMIDLGEPKICLYNARTGEQVRQLTGHLFTIRYLVFSSSGTRLVSTADDQTVCVWNLADLPGTVGKLSLLKGVACRDAIDDDKKTRVVVGGFDDASLLEKNRGKLGVGDEIKAVMINRKAVALENAQAFYHAIASLEPDEVTLQVKPQGQNGVVDVVVKLSQGIDERKPLFTLFAKKGGDSELDWIGWHPQGNYEFSDLKMEKYLAWHFNTGKAEDPVSIGKLEDHRKLNTKGLLASLMSKGTIPIPPPPPLPTPRVSFGFEEAAQKKEAQAKSIRPVVEAREGGERITLPPSPKLVMYIDRVPAGDVEEATWKTIGGSGDLELQAGGFWTADIAGADWKRGESALIINVRFREGTTAEPAYAYKLPVRFQPRPPSLKLLGDEPKEPALQATYKLEAEVAPSPGDGNAIVTMFHQGKLVANPKNGPVKEKSTLEWTVELQPGTNTFKVVAQNDDALEGHEAEERIWVVRTVIFDPAMPRISILRVNNIELLGKEPGATLSLDGRSFDLAGKIETKDELEKFYLKLEDVTQDITPQGLGSAEKTFAYKNLALPGPGVHKLEIVAQTKKKLKDTVVLTLAYLPRLPGLKLQEAKDDMVVNWAPDKDAEVELTGKLTWPPTDAYPCKARVVVNDGKPQEIELKKNATDFKAKAVLTKGGKNVISIEFFNEWRPTSSPETIYATLRRAPVLDKIDKNRVGDRAFATVEAQLRSPADLPILRASVNGVPIPADDIKKGETKDGVTTWYIKTEVALQPGDNRLEVQAANQDGALKEPAVVTVNGVKAIPPDVRILAPGVGMTVTSSDYEISFSVQSSTKLKSVSLRRNGKIIFDDEKAAGQFDVRHTLKFTDLEPGDNLFDVMAVSETGKRTAPEPSLLIRYMATPVSVEILSLEDEAGKVLVPTGRSESTMLFPKLDNGRGVIMRGRVSWVKDKQPQMKKTNWVHVYVNGVHHLPVELTPSKEEARKDDTKEFKVTVSLHREKENLISVQLPDLAAEVSGHNVPELSRNAGTIAEARVACDNVAPEPPRAIHLLIIGSEDDNKEELTKRVLDSVGATKDKGDAFKKAGFEGGIIYGPIGEEDLMRRINFQFYVNIGSAIDKRVKDKKDADVVIVYYQGTEEIGKDGNVLRPGIDPRSDTLRTEHLREFIARTPGTQLLFLDVIREAKNAPPGVSGAEQDFFTVWPKYPNVAVVQYAWDPKRQLANALLDDLGPAFKNKKRFKDIVDELGTGFERKPDTFAWISKKYKKSLIYSLRQPPTLDDLALK